MRVITEERLIERIEDWKSEKEIDQQFVNGVMYDLETLLSQCQHIDHTIVDKLFQMSDAPRDPNTRILVIRVNHDYFEAARFDIKNNGWQINFSSVMSDDFFIGWIPMLIYKPQKDD